MSAWTKAQFGELVAVIADGDPGVWMRLRADHVAGPDGHCHACRSSNGAAPVWPCTLRAIADEAARRAPEPAPGPVLTAASRTRGARRGR